MPPTILITRPEEAAGRLADALRRRLGHDVPLVISPLMRIDPGDALPPLARFKTLIFTSVHAVRAFAGATTRRDFACYTVGGTTARAARKAGFDPVEGPGTGAGLVALILTTRPAAPCLHLRGDHVAFDIETTLVAAGIETQSTILYRQTALPYTAQARALLESPGPVIAPLFSPRSATLFFQDVPDARAIYVVAMSEAVARGVPRDCAPVVEVVERPDMTAMLDGIARLWTETNQLEGDGPAQ